MEIPHLRDSPSPPAEFTTFTPAKDPRITKFNDEYESPAFVKRARLSYGSLFEDGFDIFDDDGGVKGKGRKRTRFGRDSGAWRYSSQSRSPEPQPISRAESTLDEQEDHMSSPPRLGMADEGCQTMELDMPAPTPDLASENIASGEHQQPPPIVETLPQLHDDLIDQGAQGLPPHELLPNSPGVTLPLTLPNVSQHTFAETAPFPTNHELATIDNNLQPQWETKNIGNTTQFYDEDPAVHEQVPGGLLLPDPEDGLVHHHPPGLEDTREINPSYPPIDHTSFGKDIENNGSHEGHQDGLFYHTPQMAYPPLDIAESEESRLPTADMLNNYPPGYLENSQHFPQQQVEGQSRAFGREIESTLSSVPAEVRPTSWTTVNNASEATSTPQTRRLDTADGRSTESPVVIDEDESDDEPAPAPTAVEDPLTNGHADALEEYEDAEAEDEADAMYSDEDEPEYDVDEMGGDYDTRNYVGPDDDEDDSHDEDLRPRRLEPQFTDYEDWDEDELEEAEEEERRFRPDNMNGYDIDEEEEEGDDEDEDEDEDGEEGEEDDEEDEERIGGFAPRVSQATPMVIDLISSSEDEDESEDENEDGRESIQLPQPHPATDGDGLVGREGPTSRASQSPDGDFESQEGGMSEQLSVTSDIQEEVNEEEMAEEEEITEEDIEEMEDGGSADDEQREEALLEKDNAFDTTTETRRQEEASMDLKPIAVRERMLPPSHAPEPTETMEQVATTGKEPLASNISPFTAAEGLEVLSQTVDREEAEAEAEARDKVDSSQVKLDETFLLTTGTDNETSQLKDVEMAENEVVDSELIAQDEVHEPDVKEAEIGKTETIIDDGTQSPATDEDLEPVDLIKSSPINSPEVPLMEKSEISQGHMLAPSSPPLTQSFSSQATGSKPGLPMHESTISESQLPIDQLFTPLDTQLTDVATSQETPAISMSVESEEAHDVAHTAGLEEPHVSQVTTISEEVVEDDQVRTIEIVTTQTEEHNSGQIEIQRQTLVSEEHVQESSRASQSPKLIPSIASEPQVEFDDMIQATLRGEAPQVMVESDMTAQSLDADSSGVSSSFRSQMEGDEELQASILEDNSYLFGAAHKGSSEVDEASSPVLGFDDALKPEETQSESVGTWQMQENSQLSVESDHESMDEDSQLDPSVQLARAANATKRRSRAQQATSDINQSHKASEDGQSNQSLDEEDSSVQLARASMNALSKVEEESSSLVEAKLQLARHLRDELPDCTQLQVLRHHIGQSLDVMAVAMMQPPDPQRAKRGPREYMMSFTIADQSTAPNAVVEVQLYRPHKDALPIVKAGDVVLLRKFKVVALQGKGFGLRTEDGSSWAVWEHEQPGGPLQVRGPPVEAVAKEARHAAYLLEWFGLLDEQARSKLERANQKIIAVSSKKGSRKSG